MSPVGGEGIHAIILRLWPTEPIPNSYFGLVQRLIDAVPRIDAVKWSTCIEGAWMASARVKTFWGKMKAKSAPKGEEAPDRLPAGGAGLECWRFPGAVVVRRKRGKMEKPGGRGSGWSTMAWMPSPPTGDLPPCLSALSLPPRHCHHQPLWVIAGEGRSLGAFTSPPAVFRLSFGG